MTHKRIESWRVGTIPGLALDLYEEVVIQHKRRLEVAFLSFPFILTA